MPDLTDKQKDSLKNDGKFTDDDIELFDMYQLDYQLIKDIQNSISRLDENNGKSLEEINRQMIDFIKQSARQRQGFLSQHLRQMVGYLDTLRMASRGGKKTRNRRRNRRITKRRGRKNRKISRRH